MSKPKIDETSYNNEIVLAMVRPVGVDSDSVRSKIEKICMGMGAEFHSVKLVDMLDSAQDFFASSEAKEKADKFEIEHSTFSPAYKRTSIKMKKGSYLRQKLRPDLFALYGLGQIALKRTAFCKGKPRIILVDSIKHPKELAVFREAYGNAFFLLGINSSRRTRIRNLVSKGMSESEAVELICRDESEKGAKLGQQMTKAFEKADIFSDEESLSSEIDRFLKLILGKTILSPKRHELHMQMAVSAGAMSSDLSRQVGAALVSESNELMAIGYNEVPKAGGGLYADGDSPDHRDVVKEVDPNHVRRNEMLADVEKYHSALKSKIKEFGIEAGREDLDVANDAQEAWNRTEDRIENLIEFHRAIHAEMEVILSCARRGVSLQGSNLYTTTFPCHNCSRLIVGSGISKVIYIEAYPKSLAEDLHNDAIDFDGNSDSRSKVAFKRYVGISPRRFLDLFSNSASTGTEVARKDEDSGHVSQSLTSGFQTRFPIAAAQAISAELSSAKSMVQMNILDSRLKTALEDWIKEYSEAAA